MQASLLYNHDSMTVSFGMNGVFFWLVFSFQVLIAKSSPPDHELMCVGVAYKNHLLCHDCSHAILANLSHSCIHNLPFKLLSFQTIRSSESKYGVHQNGFITLCQTITDCTNEQCTCNSSLKMLILLIVEILESFKSILDTFFYIILIFLCY